MEEKSFLQEKLRGVGVGVLVKRVCVISSLLGTLGLAAPSPASVQDAERDVGLGKENREKVRVGFLAQFLREIPAAMLTGWVGMIFLFQFKGKNHLLLNNMRKEGPNSGAGSCEADVPHALLANWGKNEE